jgi:hypothetical protein
MAALFPASSSGSPVPAFRPINALESSVIDSPVRNCFLHIGAHKTGTTSIQHVLDTHRAELQANGYYYPATGPAAAAHHNLAWQLSGDTRFLRRSGTLDDLVAEIADRPEHVILSSEDFSAAIFNRKEAVSDFIFVLRSIGLHVNLVLYVRNYLDWATRIYLELVRAGWDVGWRETMRGDIPGRSKAAGILRMSGPSSPNLRPPYFREILERARAVGDDVIVRPYQPDGRSVCSDFLSIFGLTLEDLGVTDDIRMNQSRPLVDYLLLFEQNKARRKLEEDERAAVARNVPAGARPCPKLIDELFVTDNPRLDAGTWRNGSNGEAVLTTAPALNGLSCREVTQPG